MAEGSVARAAEKLGKTPSAVSHSAVADERIDLAMLGADKTLPEGLMEARMPTLRRYTFMRAGHPAAASLDRQAWLGWLHVVVGIADAARQTVEAAIQREGMERKVGAHVPEFSALAPLLARINMLGTTVKPFLAQDIETYGLIAARPPVDLPHITFRFFWSPRLSADPGNQWLREIVIGAYEKLHRDAEKAG